MRTTSFGWMYSDDTKIDDIVSWLSIAVAYEFDDLRHEALGHPR
jgi:hypothetical protein